MGHTAASPAVLAGLLGAVTAGIPRLAYASSLTVAAAGRLGIVSWDFLLGVAVGVGMCGVIALVAKVVPKLHAAYVLHAKATSERAAADELEDTQVIDSRVHETVEASHVHETLETPHIHETIKVPYVDGTVDAVPVQRHVEETKAAEPMAEQSGAVSNGTPSHYSAAHEATDYGDIAENYVRRLTWAERMGARARGVGQMLAERIGKEMLDGVPVITRADGSVGDVGTTWWNVLYGNAIRHDLSSLPAVDDIDMTGEHNTLVDLDHLNAWAAQTAARTEHAAVRETQTAARTEHAAVRKEQQAAVAAAPTTIAKPLSPAEERVSLRMRMSVADRVAYIASHIALIDEGVFPERRDEKEREAEDLWTRAMSAMDEREMEPAIAAGTPAEEVIDTPETSEEETAVLPFRPVAGHPEVVDKTSYVDYLLRQEFERNSSEAFRTTSRNYLRVIEGGSMSTAPTLFNIPKRDRHMLRQRPKHFAPQTVGDEDTMLEAQEA